MATRAESVMDVNGKRVLVVGLGKSGVASALFLEKRGARVTVSDAKSPDQLRHEIPLLLDHGVTVETVQPGGLGLPVIAEVERAAPFLKGKTVATTGSNGKTPTPALTGKIIAAEVV